MERNRVSRLKYLYVILIVAGLAIVVQGLYLLKQGHPGTRGELSGSPDGDYMGSETCRSCHSTQYDDWKDSFHDLAMSEADSGSVRGNFDTTFTSQGVTSRFYRRHDKYYVNTEGPDGEYHDYEVVYTFGAAPLQQYLVKFPDGRLQCLRTAWDTNLNKWFDLYPADKISPDEWLHWSRGALNWNTMCSDCHSTNVRKNFNEREGSYRTTFSLIDVSCEACHGPGRKHAEAISSPESARGEYDPQLHLYLTRGLSSWQQVDQCARCHSRRVQFTEAYDHQGEFMDHYAPEVLRDDIYYPDGQIREEVYEYGSFLQSKMYSRNVRCSDCHNPHSLKLKAQGNNLCSQCHSPAVYDSKDHHFHKVDTEGSQCVNCHMPGRVYMGNDFRRDHSLRVPRPDLSAKYNTPNACNQCHTGESNEWAAAAIVKWYGPERKFHFSEVLAFGSTGSGDAVVPLVALAGDTSQPAIARATAVWHLDQLISPEATEAIVKSLESPDHIVRYTAVNALADMPEDARLRHIIPLLNDRIRTIRYAVGNSLADIAIDRIPVGSQPDVQRNIREYEASLNTRADFPGGQLEKGIFYERRGQPGLAEQAYLKAIEMDNRFNAARLNLAHLYHGQGQNEKAIRLFEAIIEQEPAFGVAYYSLGLLLAEENRMYAAIRHLAKAAVLENNPRIYYNLGIAYQQVHQPGKAEQAYLKGLQQDAANQDLMYALSVLYIQQKNFPKARPWVRKLSELNPDNPGIRELVDMVSRGTPDP